MGASMETRSRRVREIITAAARARDSGGVILIHQGRSNPTGPTWRRRVRISTLVCLVGLLLLSLDGHRTLPGRLEVASGPAVLKIGELPVGYNPALCDPNRYAVEVFLKGLTRPIHGRQGADESPARGVRAF